MARPQHYRHNGFDYSPLLPLGVLLVAIFMVFTPLTVQVMPMFVDGAHQMFSFVWVIPLIIVAALFLTSSELLAPSYPHNRRAAAYSAYNRYPTYPNQSYYGGESPSWGLLGLMLLMLLLLPWRY